MAMSKHTPYTVRGGMRDSKTDLFPLTRLSDSKNSVMRSTDMHSFFAHSSPPNDGKVFAYDADKLRRSSDYFERTDKTRLVGSYNVPMKEKRDQYVDVVTPNRSSPHGG